MVSQRQDDGIWFEPKRYGYGAGLPVAWQGWALIAGFIAPIVGFAALAPRHPYLYAGLVTALLLAFLPICAAHTRGGWRWRWGGDA